MERSPLVDMMVIHQRTHFAENFIVHKWIWERSAWASLVAQRYRICLPMQETMAWSLCLEDPQEEDMTTHSSILTWEIPWTEEPGGLRSMGLQNVMHEICLHWKNIQELQCKTAETTFQLCHLWDRRSSGSCLPIYTSSLPAYTQDQNLVAHPEPGGYGVGLG